MDLREALGSILAPTLVIAAAEDPATPPSHGAAIATAVAGARLVVLPRGSHMAAIEHPGEVAAMIVSHVEARP
jgi:3-oxoadipate enol-lactonase